MKFLLLTVLLALAASARGDYAGWYVPYKDIPAPSGSISGATPQLPVIDPPIITPPPGCPYPPYPLGKLYIEFPGAFELYKVHYFVGCQYTKPNGGPALPCPGWPNPAVEKDLNNPVLALYYTASEPGTYTFFLIAELGGITDTNPGLAASSGTIVVQPITCQGNDPILTGFDGRTFHFDEIGEYIILESGDGYKVHSTFAGATAANSELEVMERSWTSSIRLFSPNGDMLSCALPAIVPNTSVTQATAVTSAGTTLLSPTTPSVSLAEMSATVILSEGDGPKKVVGCKFFTPKMEVRVEQVSGYEQALRFPDTEAWAAPFTWLNSGIIVNKPLSAPVTGILGSTYPADKVAEQVALASGDDATRFSANMEGEQPGPKTHRRALAAKASPFLPLTSGIVGITA